MPQEKIEERAREVEGAKDACSCASRKSLREIVGATGLNNFESALDSVERFLNQLELFDPDVALGRAAEALEMAAIAFRLVDVDHDQRLSRSEVASYGSRLDARGRQLFEWILTHWDAICRAGFSRTDAGISCAELLDASSLFRGMEFAQSNFDRIASKHSPGKECTLEAADIQAYLHSPDRHVDSRSEAGLRSLMSYLRRLEMSRVSSGLDIESLRNITPEQLWTG